MRKYVRFQSFEKDGWGVWDGREQVQVLAGTPFGNHQPNGEVLAYADLTILPPCRPSKVVCFGLNYRDHARELQMPEAPVLFLKPPSAVIAHRQQIIYPPSSQRVDYEAELAVVLREEIAHLTTGQVRPAMFALTCGNDVTARDLQKIDGQWTRAKSFDTFCPLGPCLVTNLEPAPLRIRMLVNGEVRQDGSTADMIFPVAHLISFVSEVMTLYPGDVIMTGTPSGIGPVQPGDTLQVEIENIGILTNKLCRE
jgi:2-keto-4-pentenoate hydratase/2-oxohepta-3-ene-1,7-dioic acid hydratase in catechol pathway